MAEFNIKISSIKGVTTYDPLATLDTGSLNVLRAVQSADYTDETTPMHAPVGSVNHYSKDVIGLYIPGTLLTPGSKWLVRYDGVMGVANDKTNIRTTLVDNRNFGTPRIWAISNCEGPYWSQNLYDTPPGVENDVDLFFPLPFPLRNSSMSGWMIYTANGSDLEFNFINKSGGGVACYWRGFTISCIPLATISTADYGYAYGGSDFGNSVVTTGVADTFGTHISLDFTAPQTGDYLVFGCVGAAVSTNTGQPHYRLTENDVDIATEWFHEVNDFNDVFPVNFSEIRSYTSGQSVSIKLLGLNSATTLFTSYNPRIIILRLGTFQRTNKTEQVTGLATPITATYPNWQTVATVPLTPIADTGEYVLAHGRVRVRRTDAGTVLARVRILETGERLHEPVAVPNTKGADFDRNILTVAGTRLVNTTYNYELQVCLADNRNGNTGFYGDPQLTVIGLTKYTGAANTYYITVGDETATNSDSTIATTGGGGGNTFNANINDSSEPAENANSSVSIVHQPAPPQEIPTAHPRLWFYNNDRLAYLRTRVGSAEWNYMLSKSGSNIPFEMWIPLLKWKVTQNAADLTAMLARLDQLLAYFDTAAGVTTVLDNGNGTKDGLQLHQACRNLALYYDWGFDDAGNDVLGATRRARTANAMLIAVKTVMNPNTDIVQFSSWGLDNPYNNHNFQQMIGCTYVAIALYGEQPTSYIYPWPSGATYQFTIPRDTDTVRQNSGFSGTKVFDTDMWTWLQHVVNEKQLPAIDASMYDGWTDEGTNYGRSSVHRMLELYSLLKNSAGINHIDSHPAFKSHGEFHLYAIQPGNELSVNFGDQPRDNRALLEGGDRQVSLLIADTIDSFPVREYQQYWMNTYFPTMDDSVYAAFNFLLYRHDRDTIDYTTQLPTWRASTGVGLFNSRDSWASSACSVNMLGGYRYEEKHHSDFGSLQIYKGPPPGEAQLGWLLIDATLRSGSADDAGNKDDWSAHWHSCVRIATSTFPNGWPQHRYRELPVETPPPPPPPSGLGVVLNESTVGMQVFPANNWWNLDVSAAPLAPNSAAIISYLMTFAGASANAPAGSWHPDWGADPYGIPYMAVDGTQPLVTMTFTGYPTQSDYGQPGQALGYPIPDQPKTLRGWMEQGDPASSSVSGDRHLIVFDRDNEYLYEIYKANWDGSQWSGSNGACFQMLTNNRRPNGWTSGDAAGLAILPGLVKYDEMFGAGPITHATRFSVKQSDGTYVYPASHASNNDSPPVPLPMGMRIRLKSSKDLSPFPAEIQKLFQSWKTYGLILADRGGNGYVQGTMDARWTNMAPYNQIFEKRSTSAYASTGLTFDDFEVIQFGWNG